MTKAEPTTALVPSDLAWAREILPDTGEDSAYTFREVLNAITGKAPLPESDRAGSIDPILARVLSAATLDEGISAMKTTAMEDLNNVTLLVDNPRWFPSEFEGGARAFCVVEAVEEMTGLVHSLVIGSQQPQVVIWRAFVEGLLPLQCRITRSAKPTRAGFFPYNIVRAVG